MAIFHHFPWCSTTVAPWKSGKNHHEITILIGENRVSHKGLWSSSSTGVLNIAQLLVVSVSSWIPQLSYSSDPKIMCSILGWNGQIIGESKATPCYSMLQHATCLIHLLHSSCVSIFIFGRLTFLLGHEFLLLLLSNETIHGDHALAVVQHSQAEFQSPDDLSEFRRPLRLRINQKTPRFQVSDPCPSSRCLRSCPYLFVDFFLDRLKTRNPSYLIIIHQLFFFVFFCDKRCHFYLPDGMVGWKPIFQKSTRGW